MGNTGLTQQALKYKPTGRRDRGDREYDGRTKLFSKDTNRLNVLNLREVQKKKEEKEELLGFTLRYYEVISIHDTYPIHLTRMVETRTS
jgi:hypothetical protein